MFLFSQNNVSEIHPCCCMFWLYICFIADYYGLNVYISPKFTFWSPNPYYFVIWSWGLLQVIRCGGEGPHDGISAIRGTGGEGRTSSSCHVRTQQEFGYLQVRNKAHNTNWICCILDLGLPSLQNCEK